METGTDVRKIMKIGTDVDEVLVPFVANLCIYHNGLYGTNKTENDLKIYRFETIFNLTPDESFKRISDFYETDLFRNIPLHPFAREFIAEIARRGYLNHLITSRYADAREFTPQWAGSIFGSDVKGVLFTADSHYDEEYTLKHKIMSKADTCIHHGLDVIIEDNLINATVCAEKGMRVILMDKLWNQNGSLPERITRAYNWGDVLREIDRIDFLRV
jgi:uncharacterized HAD superfamily protein